jgi:hypothetical protein
MILRTDLSGSRRLSKQNCLMRTSSFWLILISKTNLSLSPRSFAGASTTTRIGHCPQMNAPLLPDTDTHFLHQNCVQMLQRKDSAQASLQTTCPADAVINIMIETFFHKENPSEHISVSPTVKIYGVVRYLINRVRNRRHFLPKESAFKTLLPPHLTLPYLTLPPPYLTATLPYLTATLPYLTLQHAVIE